MKKFKLFFISCIFLTGCTYKTFTLADGIIKATSNPKAYSNKSKFREALLNTIDTTVIYRYCCSVSFLDSSFWGSKKSKYSELSYSHSSFISAYKFYSNGCVNLFILKASEDSLTKEMLDPNRTGWRGVYYYDKKNRIKSDLITQINGIGTIGKLSEWLEFKGDSLFVSDHRSNYKEVYLKKKIPGELPRYRADW